MTKSLSFIWNYLVASIFFWRFHQIVWPSQDMWTLSKCFIILSIKPEYDESFWQLFTFFQNPSCSHPLCFWISEQFAFWRHRILSKQVNKETHEQFEKRFGDRPNISFASWASIFKIIQKSRNLFSNHFEFQIKYLNKTPVKVNLIKRNLKLWKEDFFLLLPCVKSWW